MSDGYRFGNWFVEEYGWARMALPAGVISLASLPIFVDPENIEWIILYTLLPVYMIHQYEEHSRGRFVEVFNEIVAGGRPVLTPTSAFWINILEVWVVSLVSFYLARYVATGFAFIPIYGVLVNALVHILSGVARRSYNPGLYTAVAIFVPLGAFVLIYFNSLVESRLLFNVAGFFAGVLLHVVILIYAFRKRSSLVQASPTDST